VWLGFSAGCKQNLTPPEQILGTWVSKPLDIEWGVAIRLEITFSKNGDANMITYYEESKEDIITDANDRYKITGNHIRFDSREFFGVHEMDFRFNGNELVLVFQGKDGYRFTKR